MASAWLSPGAGGRRARAVRDRGAVRAEALERLAAESARPRSSTTTPSSTPNPALIASVTDALGPIDILITNTGGPPAAARPAQSPREEWERAHRTLRCSRRSS